MNNEQIHNSEKQQFDLFDTIWEKAVEKTIKERKSVYTDYGYFSPQAKKIARRWFYNEAQTFVYSFMINETKNIDRHKIAACMMKAILIAKPFRINFFKKAKCVLKNIEVPDMVYLMNQSIALNVAILILQGYIASDDQKAIKHNIYFPEPFPEDPKDYIRDVCLDLYYTQPHNVNAVTYANVFFLWEKYSCRKVQGDNLEKELRKHLEVKENEEKMSSDEIDEKILATRMQSETVLDALIENNN